MKTMTVFLEHLALLQSATKENLQNPFIQHGIIHVFMEQFDLAICVFQEALRQSGQGLAAMGSPKEVIMAAYEEYLFVDEDTWLHMLRDYQGLSREDDLKPVILRILMQYVPAWQTMADELRAIEKTRE